MLSRGAGQFDPVLRLRTAGIPRDWSALRPWVQQELVIQMPSDNEEKVVQLADHRPKAETAKVLRQKWKTGLDKNYAVVPSVLLRNLPGLGVRALELAVLVMLIDFWWKPADMPWPAKAKLAQMLGVSEKTIQRAIKRLIDRGLIKSEARYRSHGGQTSNRYDLTPLVERLEAVVKDIKEAEAKAAQEKAGAVHKSAPKAKSPAAKDV
jgi:predicted transcriptional regulator